MKIFGYGTLITKKMYSNKRNIRPAYLPGYYRVVESHGLYPFILKDSGKYQISSGFWGLTFHIDSDQIRSLDTYEGEGSLYKRIEEKCVYADGTEDDVFLYYPMQNTILQNKLEELIHLGDLWQKKIEKENPEILSEFPDLKRIDDPRL
ncbi:MAG: gamma-glutamylcyclotransferase [archaeon]|nr:gamma-glutamylcyclotransferase [archaeon]